MAIEYMSGMHGFAPQIVEFPSAGALAKGVAVALNASGKLILATGTTGGADAMIGIAEDAATGADQTVKVTLCGPDAILRFNKTGAAAPAAGTKYDIAADGLSVNADDVTNPKIKCLGLWPGETALYMGVNISFDL